MKSKKNTSALPHLPKNWSDLTWQQLRQCWEVKMRYGGNPDVARVAALLKTLPQRLPWREGRDWRVERGDIDPMTGEQRYIFSPPSLHGRGRGWVFTPRELAWMAKKALPWFDFPYGDQGEPEQRDEQGKVTKERREAVNGYVNPDYDKRDALALPIETLTVRRRHFALPQVACVNYTWQQYRTLQAIAPQLFRDGMGEEETLDLQAQFVANSLVPRSVALFDTNGGTIRFRPHWAYVYDPVRADRLTAWWRQRNQLPVLFHICFQAYHTAILSYERIYPLLFSDSGKSDPLRTAISGESATLNSVMKYQGYSDPQQVYDANLPIILDTLNTMAKEAKEIEKMNSKIKKK